MRKGKRFFATVLAAVMTVSLVACGDKPESNTPTGTTTSAVENTTSQPQESDGGASVEKNLDPVTVMATAQENVKEINSLEAKMVMEMDMTVSAQGQEQAIQSLTTMDMVCFNDPMKIKMDMTMDMGELGSVDQSIYGEITEDGNCTMYLFDGTSWQTQTVSMGDMEQYNAQDSILDVIKVDASYQEEGKEEVDGAAALKYSHVMTGDEMKETLLSSGALDSVTSLGIDPSQMESMLDGLGEMTEYIWIDEATMYPVKYEVDMTEIMDKLMVNMISAMGEQAQGMSINIPKMKMTMTCMNYNTAEDFEIPEEAKAN